MDVFCNINKSYSSIEIINNKMLDDYVWCVSDYAYYLPSVLEM
jgi:hypothetical protein